MPEERGAPQRHQEYTLILHRDIDGLDVESLMFPIPLRPAQGKAIVIMVPDDNVLGRVEFEGKTIELIAPEGVKGTTKSRYQPDIGIVARFTPRRDSNGNIYQEFDKQLQPGMIVGVTPFHGNWYTRADFDWIPEGRMIKILGTVDDISDDILVEFVQQKAS